jgi:hypothetical protein
MLVSEKGPRFAPDFHFRMPMAGFFELSGDSDHYFSKYFFMCTLLQFPAPVQQQLPAF